MRRPTKSTSHAHASRARLWASVASACFVVSLGVLAPFDAAAQRNYAPTAIEETQIAQDPFSMGVLTPETGALPVSLWANADADQLALLLEDLPARPASSVLGDLARRILLSPTAAPQSTGKAQIDALAAGKLLALARAGHTEETRTIASLSNATRSSAGVNRALAEADLLDGDLDAACRRNNRVAGDGRSALFWVKLRVLCYAADEEYDAADLTLGILREQGGLSDDEAALFTAASIPAPLKKPVAPVSALHLAALRLIKSPLPPRFLDVADPGVLAAVALDDNADIRLRVVAGERAFYAGRLSAAELTKIYKAAPAEDATLVDLNAGTAANDPLSAAWVYQKASVMASPDFDRDKAGLLGRSLGAAADPYAAFALSKIFSSEIKNFSGLLLTQQEAGGLAVASMLNGDAEAAGKWLLAMLGGGLSTLEEPMALAFLERASLLAVLDPGVGAAIAGAANVELSPPTAAVEEGAVDRVRLAAHVEAAIDAVANDAIGQEMLAAIVLAGEAGGGDPVAASVSRASLRAAGLEEVARQHAFEIAWRASFPEAAPAPATPIVDPDDEGFAPSLKPQSGD